MRCGNATCTRRSTRYTVCVGKAAIPPVTELQAVPLDAVVDLVNEWSTVARRTAQEQDRSFPEFPHFAAAHGLDTNEFGRQLDNDDLVRVADSLYPAFSVPGDDEAAAHLNSLLAEAKPTPRLALDRGRIVDSWTAPAGRTALLAGCVLALRELLIEQGGSRRLGVCSGIKCADVYIDGSPGGHKRFCDIRCQNRARINAFRRAKRTTDTTGV